MRRTIRSKTSPGAVRRTALNAVFPTLFLGLMLTAGAQDVPLPRAETLFEQFIQKTGGQAVYDRIQNRLTKSTMKLSLPSITAEVTSLVTRSGLYRVVVDSQDIGKIEFGSDGRTVWDFNPMSGPQIREGRERSRFQHLYSLDLPARWRKVFKSVECTGLEVIEGKPAFKVVAVSLDDYSPVYYFEQTSGFLIKIEYPMETAVGPGVQEIFLSDYQTAGGILYPHVQKRREQVREMDLTFTSIEYNVVIPENAFTLPEAIKRIAGPGR